MQIKVISLKRSPKRLERFIEKNSEFIDNFDVFEAVDGSELTHENLKEYGFDTCKTWRDPIKKRTLSKGEIGCFISHWALWKECVEAQEPFLILEDDVVFTKKLPANLLEHLGESDLYYFDWNEMIGKKDPDKVTYPYWTCAYLITPRGAEIILKSKGNESIIPPDEFLPFMSDRLKLAGIKDSPIKLEYLPSETEPTKHSDYFIDFDTHVLTVASDDSKAECLFHSANENGIEVKNIFPDDGQWNGGLQNYSTGGGIKLNLLRDFITDLPDHDVVLFTDAYDVLFNDTLDSIIGKYLAFKTEVLFSAERYNWPDKTTLWPPVHTPYRYLCSGMFMGRVRTLKRMIGGCLRPDQSDQLYLQELYRTKLFDCKLDVENYLFCNHEPRVEVKRGLIFNPVTKVVPSIYHGNGGPEAKENFTKLYNRLFVKNYLMAKAFTVIGPEMLLIDYKTSEQCQEWIDLSEANGGWNPHPDDNHPSHDIHLKKLGLWQEAEDHWHEVVAPIIHQYWNPCKHHHLRKAFTMKYSADTQKTLGLHTDASHVTGSVKLNDDYEGAVLHWPRQDVNNSEIPIGKMVLFPGMVTHGHYVDELKSGTKYSATFWSARYKGEYLD